MVQHILIISGQSFLTIAYPDLPWLIIITRNLYCTAKCRSKLKGADHCTSAKRMTSILRHVAEAFLLVGIVTYIMMKADV